MLTHESIEKSLNLIPFPILSFNCVLMCIFYIICLFIFDCISAALVWVLGVPGIPRRLWKFLTRTKLSTAVREPAWLAFRLLSIFAYRKLSKCNFQLNAKKKHSKQHTVATKTETDEKTIGKFKRLTANRMGKKCNFQEYKFKCNYIALCTDSRPQSRIKIGCQRH